MKNFMVLRGCLIKCWKMPYSKVLLDNIGELFESANEPSDPETVTIYLLQVHSFHTKQAYIETDYFGGIGTQSGILYENGNISIPLCSGEESITIFINSLVEEENDEDGEA